MRLDVDYARELDRQDPLAHFRDEFIIADPDLIYMDGNSLGRLPKRTLARLKDVVEIEWGQRLIRGWGEGWYDAPQRIGAKIARLIGAQPDEVIVTDSTTVDLFKLVMAALGARPTRHNIVTDDINFPSDLYVLQGAARLAGSEYCVRLVHSEDGLSLTESALQDGVSSDTALLALSHTAFKSGYMYNMAAVTQIAHRHGALMLWDLSHSVGAVPVALNASEVDLAVGCTYKYLNGGPGAPAFLYVRRDLQERLLSPIWGWFGQRDQFDMRLTYEPAPGPTHFLAGTPSLLSLAAIEPGVDLLLEAGMDRLRAKSVAQTDYVIGLWEARLKPLGVTLNSPTDSGVRGSHVALGHPEGLRIDRALIEDMKVIPDFRYPDNIRLSIAPIYTSFAEIHEAVGRIRQVITGRLYEKYPTQRPQVT
ncbi:MAG TPA: kynureninase [Aggregatilineaceae bacterium]|nr:kynureninase [Aggregatilineaceae bacterium]